MPEDGAKKMASLTCKVCGDRAFGHNFNAITCESCKAFFRRNALKAKSLKCPFTENCNIDTITRKFCQKCRLEKCLKIGMKKEWIMTEEEKKQKKANYSRDKNGNTSQHGSKRKGERNRIKSRNKKSLTSDEDSGQENSIPINRSSFPDDESAYLQHTYSYIPTSYNTSVDDLNAKSQAEVEPKEPYKSDFNGALSSDACSSQSSSSSYTQQNCKIPEESENTSFDLQQCFQSSQYNIYSKNQDSTLIPYSVIRVALEAEFSKVPIRILGYNPKILSDVEESRINELIHAGGMWDMAVPSSDPSLIDIVNMTDQAIRRLIKMSKKLAAFKNLCQDDQIALLKGGCTELMILRSVMSYNPMEDCWQNSRTRPLKMDVLKQASNNVYEEHKRFICSFNPEWRTNDTIMLLLSAVALFTPERPNTLHKDTIKLEQDTYYFLLRRYLETQYSGCRARSDYLKLIQKIQELHILNERHIRIYMDVNPKDVEPLLIEIFDLKNCSSQNT